MSVKFAGDFRAKYADMLKDYPDLGVIWAHTRDVNVPCGTCRLTSYIKIYSIPKANKKNRDTPIKPRGKWSLLTIRETPFNFFDYFDIVNQISHWRETGRTVKVKQIISPYAVPTSIAVISPDEKHRVVYNFDFDPRVWVS